MSDRVSIILSGTPVGKGRPRFAQGHTFTPAKTRSYEAMLRLAAQDEMGGRIPLDGPLSVSVIAWMPIPASWSKKKRAMAIAGTIYPTGKPDADNLLKAVDALNEVVWRDDSQIVSAHVEKRYSEKPALAISIEPMREPALVTA